MQTQSGTRGWEGTAAGAVGVEPFGAELRHGGEEAKPHRRRDRAGRRARRLGWFSIGLGLSQLFAPRRIAQAIGVADDRMHCAAMRALGLREIAAGLGILGRPQTSGWLWMRFVGDLMDLALLGAAFTARKPAKPRVSVALASVLGVSALDLVAAVQTSRGRALGLDRTPDGALRITRSMTVGASPEEVYRYWRHFENLPRFMAHLHSVQILGERRSHWTAIGPAGRKFEWDAEIVEERPNQMIAWRSVGRTSVPNAGVVRFQPVPGGRGTEIHLELEYDVPGGILGAALAKLLGKEPGQQAEGDLRRFKQVIETGEVVHSDASIHRGPHPARPSSELAGRRGGAA